MDQLQPLSTQDAEELLEAAIAAPSMHNTQPWRFALDGNVITVHLDPDRMLPAEDPSGRAAHLSAGAVVFNLRARAEQMGLHSVVRWLPEPGQWTALASVAVFEAPRQRRLATLAALATEIDRRHTTRDPLSDRRIPQRVLDSLRVAAEREGALLDELSPDARARLVLLAGEADVLDTFDAARMWERARWIGGVRRRDGVPSANLGQRPTEPGTPVRRLSVAPAAQGRPVRYERAPTLVVLSTVEDTPVDWLTAGMALQRLLLTATKHGLVASFLNQPLERSELRFWVADLVRPSGNPHLVIRLGYGDPAPPAPRRPVGEFWRKSG